MTHRHFASTQTVLRGSSRSTTFNCEVCDHRTRMTTQDDNRYCGICYELAGVENSFHDDGVAPWVIKARDMLLRKIEKRGGDIAKVKASFKALFEAKL